MPRNFKRKDKGGGENRMAPPQGYESPSKAIVLLLREMPQAQRIVLLFLSHLPSHVLYKLLHSGTAGPGRYTGHACQQVVPVCHVHLP